ncbi:hypothetical protein [Nitrosomonas sp. Nm34]|uniref:hypothetical protein n=1 Tax=Nitrosomonas sp. Nm34 TaxID=1881055 RepID=UPI0008E506D4|nr:hypothetical protein [Nitrosomonas sp. Nm34]SFI39737.1 Outer membrane lipoprotein SlyB [Nitrosomonas sp. Nm34]
MKYSSHLSLASFCAALILSGCATKGEEYQANVFKAGQVNQAQEVKTIEIMMIQEAKIEVDNAEAKKQAQVIGGILGAVGGGVGTSLATKNNGLATAGGVVGGSAAGAAVGSLVSDKALVAGVNLTYKDSSGKIMNSAQVGRLCEYKQGTAMVISSQANETRIQPNNPSGCTKG